MTLTVKDSKGGSDTETKMLTVAVPGSPPPAASYNLTVAQTGDGNVVADPKGTNCGVGCTTYGSGTEVTLTAQPDAGSSFAGWGGDCAASGTSPTCKVTVDSAKMSRRPLREPPRRISSGSNNRVLATVTSELHLPAKVAASRVRPIRQVRS